MNAKFTFNEAREQVGYFARLGISHLYLSPILAARRGSMHGYDVVDPTRVNPELGTEDEFRALAGALHEHDMGLVVDIVPNHMGIGPENPYWEDVLAHGERSRFAKWFDIDWAAHPRRKLVLPVLGDELEKVLERGEISVKPRGDAAPRIHYFAQSFPIDPRSAAGGDRLPALLADQHYELAFWRRGASDINYRRFFDVNDLAALRVEDEDVFQATHDLILRFVRDDVIDGLRVDHVDGLLDPRAYLHRLREAVGPDKYIIVEKILSTGEILRTDWPIQGTTGYEFLNDLEDVFLDAPGYAEVEAMYRRMRRLGNVSFHDIARAGKVAVLSAALRPDVKRLAKLAQPIALSAGHRWTDEEIIAALTQLIASLPVYRTYIDGRATIDDTDRALVEHASMDARQRDPALASIVAFIAAVMLDAVPGLEPAARLSFVGRLQQVSGPATAKGVEDTALYQYKPLASRNEVGGGPDRPLHDAVGRLHAANSERAKLWPRSMLTTNTHDTKRSADVRARLDVISEIPHEWERAVKRWRRLNDKHRRAVKGRMAPDTNGEYLAYQMLVALWPAPRATRRVDDLPDRAWRDAARDRLVQYMLKAVKEAKTRTSWVDPNREFEDAVSAFIAAILEPAEDAPFLSDVARFVSRIALPAAWNSFSRLAIHLTSPGVPDIYQGDEVWSFALVDPDNRRPVDYTARAALMRDAWPSELNPFDNATKLAWTRALLSLRRAKPVLFLEGAYRPLDVRGPRAEHVVAFARSHGDDHAITLAGRTLSALSGATPNEWWADTIVELPADLQGMNWKPLRGGVAPAVSTLHVGSLLATLPTVVLAN